MNDHIKRRERVRTATRVKRTTPARGVALTRAERERLQGFLTVAKFLRLKRGRTGV